MKYPIISTCVTKLKKKFTDPWGSQNSILRTIPLKKSNKKNYCFGAPDLQRLLCCSSMPKPVNESLINWVSCVWPSSSIAWHPAVAGRTDHMMHTRLIMISNITALFCFATLSSLQTQWLTVNKNKKLNMDTHYYQPDLGLCSEPESYILLDW